MGRRINVTLITHLPEPASANRTLGFQYTWCGRLVTDVVMQKDLTITDATCIKCARKHRKKTT
jgi:hypothetical protein